MTWKTLKRKIDTESSLNTLVYITYEDEGETHEVFFFRYELIIPPKNVKRVKSLTMQFKRKFTTTHPHIIADIINYISNENKKRPMQITDETPEDTAR